MPKVMTLSEAIRTLVHDGGPTAQAVADQGDATSIHSEFAG